MRGSYFVSALPFPQARRVPWQSSNVVSSLCSRRFWPAAPLPREEAAVVATLAEVATLVEGDRPRWAEAILGVAEPTSAEEDLISAAAAGLISGAVRLTSAVAGLISAAGRLTSAVVGLVSAAGRLTVVVEFLMLAVPLASAAERTSVAQQILVVRDRQLPILVAEEILVPRERRVVRGLPSRITALGRRLRS